MRGYKTRIIAGLGSVLIILIQLGILDAENYDRFIDLLMMTGFITLHAAVTRKR